MKAPTKNQWKDWVNDTHGPHIQFIMVDDVVCASDELRNNLVVGKWWNPDHWWVAGKEAFTAPLVRNHD